MGEGLLCTKMTMYDVRILDLWQVQVSRSFPNSSCTRDAWCTVPEALGLAFLLVVASSGASSVVLTASTSGRVQSPPPPAAVVTEEESSAGRLPNTSLIIQRGYIHISMR